MNWALDHVVLVVADLEEAITRFRAAGFGVEPGGMHEHSGAANALIGLQDGSYVELFSFVDLSKAPRTHTNWPAFGRGGGLVSFWASTDDLDRDLAAMKHAGVDLGPPREGSRRRPDGMLLSFRLVVPPLIMGLPAVIQDITPRTERVPAGRPHRNGVSSIARLVVEASDVPNVTGVYAQSGFSTGAAAEKQGTRVEFFGTTLLLRPSNSHLAGGLVDVVLGTDTGTEVSLLSF